MLRGAWCSEGTEKMPVGRDGRCTRQVFAAISDKLSMRKGNSSTQKLEVPGRHLLHPEPHPDLPFPSLVLLSSVLASFSGKLPSQTGSQHLQAVFQTNRPLPNNQMFQGYCL
jgi:hypothetical protein